MTTDPSGAAARGELLVHFQPQQDLTSGRIVAVEALARWHHPELGTIPPNAFIPIAEWVGAIHEVGEFVLEETCRQAAEWTAASLALEVSINVSPLQLTNNAFAELAISTVRRHRLRPETVTLEITEAEPIVDLPNAVAALGRVREFGMGVSVDDFGIGYSSIEQVRNLPATELKIDQSLIRGSRATARRMLRAVIDDAHADGLCIVAEGIETDDQLDLAIELGCDRAQGYLIGRPMPGAALAASLR